MAVVLPEHPNRPATSPGTDEAMPGFDAEMLTLADRLVDEVSQTHRFHHVALFLHDPAVDRLRLVGQRWGAGEDTGQVIVGEWLVDLDGVCGRAFRTGAAVLVPDVRLEPDYLTFPGSRTRSELAVALAAKGRPIGVVNIESPWVGHYGIEDLEALKGWAAIVGPQLGERLARDPG